MQVFSQINQGDITSTDHAAKKDDEDEERDEHLTLCSCLDGVISHLQKQMETLKSYQRQPQEPIETTGAVQSKIVDMSSYTSGYRQHCMYTLLHELRHTGAQTPALAMLVEPLLPRAWRKELDKQKILKDDADTNLYATGIAEQDIAQASEEEGSP
ncbi:TPA: hypothetical protein ACH3X3_003682 [Trebouxia sp. C0006]